jgi:CubicO group peptidase (beta-lactamase class C family)
VVRHDALMLARGDGMANIGEARLVEVDSTLFRIGSVAKTLVWTAVMMLVERGHFDLDADVNTYLQGVKVAEAFDAPVTMRQLRHHRARFQDSMRLFAVGDDDPRSLAEWLSEQQPARVYPPAARTSQSNWGAALAAQVVADVSGMDYGEVLRSESLAPLGMQSTTFAAPSKLDEATRARLARGYQDGKGALAVQDYMPIGAW